MVKKRDPQVSASSGLLEIPCPFLSEVGVARLLEPADADPATLYARLIDGSYGKPFLFEHGDQRLLYFSFRFVQSAMRLGDPDALDLAYTQKMMTFLLFNAKPRNLLLIGLGGGSVAKFCYRRLPGTRITVLEIDPNVIAFRDQFLLPPDDERLTVIQGDGARYVAEQAERTDVLLVDAFDHEGVAPALADPMFYESAHRCLSANGIFVMNIAGEKSGYGHHLEQIREVFGDNVIAMSVKDDGNYIVFGFKNADFEPRWTFLKSLAQKLQARLGLDFPRFAQQLERGHKLRLAKRL